MKRVIKKVTSFMFYFFVALSNKLLHQFPKLIKFNDNIKFMSHFSSLTISLAYLV